MYSKDMESNVRTFLFFRSLVGSSAFFLPTMVLFWQSQHLSIYQITILPSVFALSSLLWELPTGYFADKYGRKKSLLLGAILFACAMALYCVTSTFLLFAIAEATMAMGLAFISGADTALLYESLVELGRKNEYKKLFGRIMFYALLVMGAFSIFGSFVMQFNMRVPLYLTAIATLFLIPLAIAFKEPQRHQGLKKMKSLQELWHSIKEVSLLRGDIRWVIISNATIYAAFMVAMWFYQPYFQLIRLNTVYFGVIFALFNLIAALVSKYAHAIEDLLGRTRSFGFMCVLLAGSYFLMGGFVWTLGFLFAGVQQAVRGFYQVVSTDHLNQVVASEKRATMLSLQTLSGKLLYAVLLPLYGMIATNYGLLNTFLLMGLVTLSLGILWNLVRYTKTALRK